MRTSGIAWPCHQWLMCLVIKRRRLEICPLTPADVKRYLNEMEEALIWMSWSTLYMISGQCDHYRVATARQKAEQGQLRSLRWSSKFNFSYSCGWGQWVMVEDPSSIHQMYFSPLLFAARCNGCSSWPRKRLLFICLWCTVAISNHMRLPNTAFQITASVDH